MSVLIAFCANGRRAGKDTAANFVEEWCEQEDLTCERLAFADKMKQLVALTLGHGAAEERDWQQASVLIEQLKLKGHVSWSLSKTAGKPMTGRDFIINLAEGCRQLFGADFWTNAILPPDWVSKAHVTVVTDLRFSPEADRILALDGKIVEINRIYAEGGASEGELAKYSPNLPVTRIYNDGPIESLRHCIFSMLDQRAKG